MEKIESTTKCAADQIRQILNKLEKKNREIVLESIVKEEEDEVRPAGITRPILNNSEVIWRRYLRGYRHLPRY